VSSEAFIAALGDIPVITDRALVRQKSRDFFWYSPLLKQALNQKSADLVVCPRNEEDVVRTAALCAQHKVPLTVRGAGTGNYGQSVPLEGGVVLDMAGLKKLLSLEGGLLTVEAGACLMDIETAVRPQGWELRMYPSTKRSATIGGFVAGGSGGIGSITYGGLRERGNIVSARVVSCEEEPRIVTLTGDEIHQVNHAYGTTGIITRLGIPLAPLLPWIEVVASFDDFMAAARCARALTQSDGIAKKLASVMADPIPQFFRGIEAAPGAHLLIALVAEHALVPWSDLLAEHGGREILRRRMADAEAAKHLTPVYEYTWNHTTLQVLKKDKSITYLQSLFPAGRELALVEEMRQTFGDEVQLHLEFIRAGGAVTCSALQIVRFTSEARLYEIIRHHEGRGILIANPHVYTLEDGAGHKRIGEGQPAFKRKMDPYGLLNPGKMRTYQPIAQG
jgi:FAD/FMN-containing dehydrogenase